MATYKIKYSFQDKEWTCYANNVINSHEAIEVCDLDHPEIPKEAFAIIELISE